MKLSYHMEADKALVRKYGRTWWKGVRNPGFLAGRVERAIYRRRSNLAPRLYSLVAGLVTGVTLQVIFAFWRVAS